MSLSNTLSPSASTTAGAFTSLAGRVLLSIIFLVSGWSKLAAPALTIAKIEASGLPFAPLGLVIAIAIEILGSLCLIAGYRTRLVATAFVVYSLATALAFHNHLADQNQFIHFLKNVAIAGGFLQVVVFGGGTFSLDNSRIGAAKRGPIESGALRPQ